MTLDQFINWALAQGTVAKYNDGQFGGECVSLINQYCWRVLNVPADAWGNAKDWANNGSVLSYFTRASDLQRGDVLVYAATASNSYGHIEIYLGNNESLQQNRFLNRRVGRNAILNGYIAILRPRNSNSIVSAPSAGGSTVDTIKSMYWRLLGRAADQGGIDHYTKEVQKSGFEFVYNDLKNSVEGQNDWARRNPDRVNALEAGIQERDQKIHDLQVALANEQNKPPKEVIKEVVQIVEKPIGGIDEATKNQIAETHGIVKALQTLLSKIFK